MNGYMRNQVLMGLQKDVKTKDLIEFLLKVPLRFNQSSSETMLSGDAARSSGWLLGLLSFEKVKRKKSKCTALYTGENKEVHCETRGFNQMQFANF